MQHITPAPAQFVKDSDWVGFPGGELEGKRPKALCPEGRQQLQMHSKDLTDIAVAMRVLQRRAVGAIVGAGLLIVAAVLYALEAGGPRIAGVPASAWAAGIGGLWALLAAWPRR